MPLDTTAPTLVSFTLPDVIDVSNGPALLSTYIDADDQSGITSAYVWFDDEFSYSFSTTSPSYSSWSLMILNDEVNTDRLVSASNSPGTYSVNRISVEDGQGNERTYEANELEALGFDTSFEIVGSTLDTTAPTLVSFTLPDAIDVSNGAALLSAYIDVDDDQSGISSAIVWFDDEFSYSFSTTSPNYSSWSLMILNDEVNTDRLVSANNSPGTYSVNRISLEDGQGNERTYEANELEALGFDTSFEIFSGPPSESDPTAELSFEGPIEVVEGTSITLPLMLRNLTNAEVSYHYSFSSIGASTVAADFSGGTGQGQIAVLSTAPTVRSVEIPFTALADNQSEGPETVFLDISVSGAVFADGFATQRYEITILDNERPTGVATATGEATEDAILTANISGISDADGIGVGSFQWRKDGLSISGETGTTYRLSDSDVGSLISFVYSYTDGAGFEESVTSAPTQVVTNVNDAVTGTLGVSGGAALVGRELTAQTGSIVDDDGLGSFNFQWLRNGAPIAGATGQNYMLSQEDVGKDVSVQVSFADGHGTLESLVSADILVASAAATWNNDLRIGNAGDNALDGGWGADTLIGNSGDDLLIGGIIEGGIDRAVYTGGFGLAVNTAGAKVYRIYQATLDRAPDSTGLSNWTARLDYDLNLEEVISGFVNSAEFQNKYGALDNAGFVTQLYQNVLGRAPDDNGLANWSASLDDGMSRAAVVKGFSESAEFKEKTRWEAIAYSAVKSDFGENFDAVFRLYQATLDRSPDLNGLENWAAQLTRPDDYSFVASGFVNSAEFQNKYGALDNASFVTQLYQNVLGRAPDDNGLANWSARLDDGMSREKVVEGFAQSQEFIANTTSAFLTFMRTAYEGDTLDGGAGDDLLLGSYRADHFIFDAEDEGNDRVFQLDSWDTIELNGFGYESTADALEHFAEVNADTVFRDGDVSIVFANTSLEVFDDAIFLS